MAAVATTAATSFSVETSAPYTTSGSVGIGADHAGDAAKTRAVPPRARPETEVIMITETSGVRPDEEDQSVERDGQHDRGGARIATDPGSSSPTT